MSLQNKTFNELLTFSRASGGGRFNAQGQYEWLPANEPRIDYDPVTGECRGILIEEQRTNLLRRSAEFDDAAWLVTFGTKSVTPFTVASPDGSVSASILHDVVTDNVTEYYQQFAVAANSSFYTGSVFIKAGTAACMSFHLLLTGGTAVRGELVVNPITGESQWRSGAATVGYSFSVERVADFFRVSVTVLNNGTNNTLRFALRPAFANTYTNVLDVSATGGTCFWGAQLEAGEFPTSYIPTTTAQVTRAADLCSVNNLSPWYRADEGTLMVDWNLPVNTSDNNQLAAFGRAGVASSMAIRMGVANGRRVRAFAQDSAAVFQYAVTCPAVEASRTTGRSAFSYKSKDDFAASSAGSLGKDVSGDISDLSVDTLRVGRNAGTYANGHIRRVRYIPRRISDTELRALTAI